MNGPSEFVDTNILVYAHDTSPSVAAKHRAAADLLSRLWTERTGSLSTQVFGEFFTVATKRLASPLSTDEAYRIIEDYSAWTVYTLTSEDILSAIRIQQRYQLSFWDALILRSAQALGSLVLWSEDLNAGQEIHGVRILNPFA